MLASHAQRSADLRRRLSGAVAAFRNSTLRAAFNSWLDHAHLLKDSRQQVGLLIPFCFAFPGSYAGIAAIDWTLLSQHPISQHEIPSKLLDLLPACLLLVVTVV